MTDINSPATNGARRRSLLTAAIVFTVIGVIWIGHWALSARFHEETDDAYVAGNVIQVTPLTAGTVVAIDADDTDFVKAGQRLVQLDDTDAKVALAQAEAELAQAVRQVRALFSTNDALRAKIALQETVLAKAEADLKRRSGLTASGAVSLEDLQHTEEALKAAQADMVGAREALAGNLVYTENTSISTHPNVLNAAAKVRAAWLALQRTKTVAAADGQVAKRSVQLGQPVSVTADIYGGKVEYSGHIVGLAAGTGSAFSLLPAQNATGNWIKVVQRLPVRVQIDKEQLQTHPLRIGLSVAADVDISDRSGPQLSAQARAQPAWTTSVYDHTGRDADARVQQIITANSGAREKSVSAQTTPRVRIHTLAVRPQ